MSLIENYLLTMFMTSNLRTIAEKNEAQVDGEEERKGKIITNRFTQL